jgi:hypothetical protein
MEKNIRSNDDITFQDPKISLKEEFLSLLDRQQQINQSAQVVVDYLYNDGKPDRLLATIGKALLREDRNFHSIQMIEAAFRQYSFASSADDDDPVNNYGDNNNTTRSACMLVAAARYLSAHSPTMRSQGHTYQIADQLYNGEHLFE